MPRLLLIGLIAAAACGPVREPVEVDWTFGGKSCADAGVASIQIDIEGEVLTPNKFTCDEAGQGAALGDFLIGTYTVTVTGFDSGDNVIYQTVQDIRVRNGGANRFTIDAAPTTGTATLDWTFGGKGCAAAGVTNVDISVDGKLITQSPGFACASPDPTGKLVDGSTIGPLTPGAHTFGLAAYGSGGAYYSIDGVQIQIVAGQDTETPIDVPPAAPTTASADVSWKFEPGDMTCAAAGVDHIWVVFDPNADGSGGTVVGDTACAGMGGAPVTEMSIVDVPDGKHSFAVRGTKNNTLLYYTHNPGANATSFSAPFTTPVAVTAEALP